MNPMLNKTPEERRAIAAKAVATRQSRKAARDAERAKSLLDADTLSRKIAELEARIEVLTRIEKLNMVSATLTGTALLREKEISAGALPWSRACGVYFLLDKDEVVYVGQAMNVYSRIDRHKEKQFDRYAFVPCHPSMLDKLESLYIHCLRPRLNGLQVNNAMYAPLSLHELIGMSSAQARVA